MMKSRIAFLSLALAGSVFALDEYLPITKGAVEIDVGVSHNAPDGGDAYQSVPLAVKYGVMDKLTLELATDFSLQDPGGGLGQPAIAAKYAVTSDIAVLANVVLPFATGDRGESFAYKGLGIAPGVIYGKVYDNNFTAAALAYYQINLKDGDDIEVDDVLNVYLKPGYLVNDKLMAYVGLNYTMQGDANQTKLLPGITYVLSSALALEANVPFVVAESNTGKYWGINAALYYTLQL